MAPGGGDLEGRRPTACPRTSERSGALGRRRDRNGAGTSGQPAWPRRTPHQVRQGRRAVDVLAARTSEASRTSHSGTTSPSGDVASASAIMPGTWRSEPFSPSSPQKARPSVQSGLSCAGGDEEADGDRQVEPGAALPDA